MSRHDLDLRTQGSIHMAHPSVLEQDVELPFPALWPCSAERVPRPRARNYSCPSWCVRRDRDTAVMCRANQARAITANPRVVYWTSVSGRRPRSHENVYLETMIALRWTSPCWLLCASVVQDDEDVAGVEWA